MYTRSPSVLIQPPLNIIMLFPSILFVLITPFSRGQQLFNINNIFKTRLSENPIIQLASQSSDQFLSSTFNFINQKTTDAISAVVDSFPILAFESDRNNVDAINKLISDFTTGQNNEDITLNVGALLLKYNQRVENHKVITEDGYILNMFRVPGNGSVVFLMHGLFGSADDFVIAGPETGLAYVLAREGYDVWMGNARGNKYSREHNSLKPSSAEFWDFSWHEIGIYDVPAMLDYVLNKTEQPTLKYIGHSQGTTVFFVLASEKPEYNDKISLMIALSPVAFMSNLKSPIIRLLAPGSPIIHRVAKSLGAYEFLPDNLLIQALKRVTCGIGRLAEILCSNVVFVAVGFDINQLNVTNLPVVFGHIPAGASVKQLEHYAQGINSGRFAKFDNGFSKNKEIYGTDSPPEYDLSRITTPVYLFYSEGDWLAHPLDVEKLSKKLSNVVEMYKVPYTQFNHLDFLIAKDLKTLVYEKLLSALQ